MFNDAIMHVDAYVYVYFFVSTVINACNASLRSDKFSAMATRTRKQYLNDLAESSVTSISIEQANTSGRVGTVYKSCSKVLIFAVYNRWFVLKILFSWYSA